METSIPVIGLAGYSNSGKTTFLEKLIAELKRRGYRVGIIKHTHHPVEFDQPAKDTWRHARAGADVVALAAPGGVSLIKKFDHEPVAEKVISMIDGVDVIVIEGYKKGKWPKIEIFQQGVTERPVIPAEELLAVVSNVPQSAGVPCFGLNDAVGTADLIERVIIKKEI
ncbi:molybdopterin-guanine dinucleotide biosynthesis protein B [Pelotomaculum terephthalicicum JT]|uniref:molybdopterin-guanine dinucleotide biosynthesis protein B n=1 Tax=Pelotomaculum TaxID=191373 RepID=UPI0009C870AE|nr:MULTISPECIES: molybdopterin-guanine dinucleotide biosynthesis protein B [Pelotomaculum]MCG9966610.1 molybdopterin-guanine dinucleotide biosynthesis protein B [Pelotomaculum terephthalicicum JT]OPX92296.1 MAG: Molybdopterin-guanine dinucleotide biosynthesis adapter protein [Pelotomaculum sp. PtaB.Bin117]OPY63549.1 MAG: Molybdopterin-guanine dinucleotide biosynthesis adapter protein [Pelotomaculum sp. PtaU1.Bin065]